MPDWLQLILALLGLTGLILNWHGGSRLAEELIRRRSG